jgi:hypothetical protein
LTTILGYPWNTTTIYPSNFKPFSYTWAENESENLSALREAVKRLRVGGDGDFCSREHRTQHRLRLGMDRLEEANKVTSLMRRRENPRHISARG